MKRIEPEGLELETILYFGQKEACKYMDDCPFNCDCEICILDAPLKEFKEWLIKKLK